MSLVDTILSPLGFGCLLALALGLFGSRMPRRMRATAIALGIACLVLSTPFGAGILLAIEESRAPAPESCAMPRPSTIVLLAGGVRHLPRDERDDSALNAASVGRTLGAAMLMHDQPGSRLVISGGSAREGAVPNSAAMSALAQRLGVDAHDIVLETRSTTTWTNAFETRRLQPAPPPRIWLVTSALHMPRALVAFRAAGFEPCAYPIDFLSGSPGEAADFLPRGGAVADSEAALHEIVGEIVYRLRAAFARSESR